MKFTELFLISLFIFSLICGIWFNSVFVYSMFAGMFLIIFYVFFTFFLVNNMSLISVFKKGSVNNLSSEQVTFSILSGFCYGISFVAITFQTLSWPGSLFFVIIALISLVISSITIVRQKKSGLIPANFYKNILRRNIGIALMVMLSLLFFKYPIYLK